MGDITSLLKKAASGDREAISELCPLVYDALHERAARYMRRERRDHTLQATVLADDAYVRLVGKGGDLLQRSRTFLRPRFPRDAAIRGSMLALHRSGKLLVEDLSGFSAKGHFDALELTDALERLESIDERAAKVVHLHILCGRKFKRSRSSWA